MMNDDLPPQRPSIEDVIDFIIEKIKLFDSKEKKKYLDKEWGFFKYKIEEKKSINELLYKQFKRRRQLYEESFDKDTLKTKRDSYCKLKDEFLIETFNINYLNGDPETNSFEVIEEMSTSDHKK